MARRRSHDGPATGMKLRKCLRRKRFLAHGRCGLTPPCPPVIFRPPTTRGSGAIHAHDTSRFARPPHDRPPPLRLLPRLSGLRVPPRDRHAQPLLQPPHAGGAVVRVPRLGQDRRPHLRERPHPPRPPRELEEGTEVQLGAPVDQHRLPRDGALRVLDRRRAQGRHLRLPLRAWHRRQRQRAQRRAPGGHEPRAAQGRPQAVTSSPPSTPITLPVIQPAPGSASTATAAATSSGAVSRPPGLRRRASSSRTSAPGILRSAGVSVTPARSAFTATPAAPSSTASWRTWDSSAALAAETAP